MSRWAGSKMVGFELLIVGEFTHSIVFIYYIIETNSDN